MGLRVATNLFRDDVDLSNHRGFYNDVNCQLVRMKRGDVPSVGPKYTRGTCITCGSLRNRTRLESPDVSESLVALATDHGGRVVSPVFFAGLVVVGVDLGRFDRRPDITMTCRVLSGTLVIQW